MYRYVESISSGKMNMKINVEVGTIQGKRDYQQDNLGFRDIAGGAKLLFLADRMGGYKGGEKASELVITTFNKYPSESNNDGEFLKKLLYQSNKKIALYKKQNPEVSQMGTTLVAMLITNRTCQWISVGDSLLYHIRGNSIQRINANHSVAGLLELQLKKGEISQEEVDKNPNKHMLTSALTGEEISIVDLSSKIEIKSNDIFVLASDGIETISKEDILRIISSSNGDMELAVKRILGEVEKANKPNQDNATIMIVSQSQVGDVDNSISKIVGISNNNTNIGMGDKQSIHQNGGIHKLIKPLMAIIFGLIVLLGGIFIEKRFHFSDRIFANSNSLNDDNISELTQEVSKLKQTLTEKTAQLGNKNLKGEVKKIVDVLCVGKNNKRCMEEQINKLRTIEIVVDKQLKVQNKINELSKRDINETVKKQLMDINSSLIMLIGDSNNLTLYDENLTHIEKILDDKDITDGKKILKSEIKKLSNSPKFKKIIEADSNQSVNLKKIKRELDDVNSTMDLDKVKHKFENFTKEINCTEIIVGNKNIASTKKEIKKKDVNKASQLRN